MFKYKKSIFFAYDFFCFRPELNSFRECFKSVFRIHSETGNIWTHLIGTKKDKNVRKISIFYFLFLIGFVAFITVTVLFYVKPLCDYCHVDIDVS